MVHVYKPDREPCKLLTQTWLASRKRPTNDHVLMSDTHPTELAQMT